MFQSTVGPVREYIAQNSTIPFFEKDMLSDAKRDILLNMTHINRRIFLRKLNYLDIESNTNNIHLKRTLKMLNDVRQREIYFVLSPGRSGTVALTNFFSNFNKVLPLHHLGSAFSSAVISEFIARMICETFEKEVDEHRCQGSLSYYADIFLRNRMVELLHSIDEKVIFVNHWESWWAPIILKIFPNSKFIYLKRNPEDVAFSLLATNRSFSEASFYSEINAEYKMNQNGSNLEFLTLNRSCENHKLYFTSCGLSVVENAIAHVRLVEELASAVQSALCESRFVSISADNLFARDLLEIEKILEFLKLKTPNKILMMHDHFLTKYNTKTHQYRFDGQVAERVRARIRDIFQHHDDEAGTAAGNHARA
jgi:hypothetical protein